MIPMLLKDFYKAGHPFQYPLNTRTVYSNMTARASRLDEISKVMSFGWQAFVLKYLVKEFQQEFFQVSRAEVLRQYKRRMANSIGPLPNYRHIEELHEIGYLPLKVKAIPEGMRIPLRVPLMTVRNTDNRFGWLTNSLETLISAECWQPITSATIAFQYRLIFEDFARYTTGQKYHPFVPWQGHDFSMRGMAGIDAAVKSGAGHLLSFTGSDTIPAIDFLETFYGADCEKELIAGSVAATEHSVMCIDGPDCEEELLERLITEVYPSGIVSVVSDTYDFWNLINHYLYALKDKIMARDGKLVIRPDSGDPTKILVGDRGAATSWERKGLIESLWDIFHGSVNGAGFKELDPHIGAIYGDSITLQRQFDILDGLQKKGFASTNVVLGIGSYTYQHVTRDTFGLAMKATWADVNGKGRAIYKDPKTDSGIKKSAKGLLQVTKDLTLKEDCLWSEEDGGLLQTIFYNGKTENLTTLAEMRGRVRAELEKAISMKE